MEINLAITISDGSCADEIHKALRDAADAAFTAMHFHGVPEVDQEYTLGVEHVESATIFRTE